MCRHNFAAIAIAALVAALIATASDVAAQGQGTASGVTVPIIGTGPGAAFDGELTVRRFVRTGDQILAIGRLAGTLTNTVTGVTSNVIRQVAIPVDLGQTSATCEILTLVLGPLDLDLLGLQIHLDQVVLNIEAEPGPGNLLGNLLCAIAGLLDGSGTLNQIIALLNQILAALG